MMKITMLYIQDESGKKENLIRDVFPSKLTIQKIFIYGNDCYYLSENDESKWDIVSGKLISKILMTH